MASGMRRLGTDSLGRRAMEILARDPSASMADVAEQTGVGRTTLYRHFGDRDGMVSHVARLGARMFGEAFEAAGPEVGTGFQAIERICLQLFALPEVLSLMFADNPIITDDVFAEVEAENRVASERTLSVGGEAVDPLEAVIVRGQRDGSIVADIPPAWAANFIFLTLGAGHLYALTASQDEDPRAARSRAQSLTVRAIARTLAVA